MSKNRGRYRRACPRRRLPAADRYDEVRFGPKTAAETVREAVLELSYTAHDMAPLAADLGHVDDAGGVRPPFGWDPERRVHLCAKLDALFFSLYGVTDGDDVRYVWSCSRSSSDKKFRSTAATAPVTSASPT